MKPVEQFIFQWINFVILTTGIVFAIRRQGKEFLSGRSEKIRLFISRVQSYFNDAFSKYGEAKKRYKNADEEAKSLIKSRIETGRFTRDETIRRAHETADRIIKEMQDAASREAMRAMDAVAKETLLRAFNKAEEILSAGVSRDKQLQLLDESLKKISQIDLQSL